MKKKILIYGAVYFAILSTATYIENSKGKEITYFTKDIIVRDDIMYIEISEEGGKEYAEVLLQNSVADMVISWEEERKDYKEIRTISRISGYMTENRKEVKNK